MGTFKGFTADAFAAFAPEKWSSNVHNLPRMRVKDALLAMCDQAQADLRDELQGLCRATSDEVPNITNHKKVDAQWIYWFRDAEARKSLASFLEKTPLDEVKLFDIAPHDKHLILAVVLRQSEIWVGLRLSPGAVVDRRNFSAILSKAWERESFLTLLRELPEGALIGQPESATPAADVTLNDLIALPEKLGPNEAAWQLGHSVPAEEAVSLGLDLADYVERWLGALVPHYRFIEWSRNNDHIEVNKQIQEEKAQKRRQALGFGPGDRVRIVSGMFTGKIGVVQDVDAKAQVKVRVGKLSVVVAGADLTPAA